MNALGMPAPSSVFSSYEKAVGTINTLLVVLEMLGKNATMREIAKATTKLEKLKVAAAFGAAGYAGACIGSRAVAIGRYAACGATIADTLLEMRQNLRNSSVPSWMPSFLTRHPEITDTKHPGRLAYATRTKN